MSRMQGTINWVAVTSEIGHFFCCGIPIIFSLLSLLSGLGLIASVPLGALKIHDFMHDYEVPMITISGLILIVGWSLHLVAQKIDCKDTGCGHPPCKPKKNTSCKILIIATGLFVLNLTLYLLLHR